MRFSRGVVKISIKYLYVFLITISTAFFLYLYILNYQKSKSQGQCRVVVPLIKQSEPKDTDERSQQKHSICTKEPEVARFEDCPHCFRPNVQMMANKFHQVQYSTSMFPRGPPDFFKPKNEVKQDFVTDYLITPHSVCVETCPFLVAIVLSIAREAEQRNTIRATWASVVKTRLWPHADVNADVEIIFVLAHQTPESYIRSANEQSPTKYVEKEHYPTLREWTRIKTEGDIHGDILYLNMQDSYYNLTLKLVSAFKWLRDHCPRVKHFLKVDMDTFINIPLLLDLLIISDDRMEYAIIGQVYTNERVVRRTNKWAVDTSVYPPPIFPVYASDCAYIMSARLLFRIVEISPYMSLNDIVEKLQWNKTSIQDIFITGILGLVLGYDYFTASDGIMTNSDDTDWYRCDIIHDKKITGKASDKHGLYKIWRSFFRYYGKCWKEIPELANPNIKPG